VGVGQSVCDGRGGVVPSTTLWAIAPDGLSARQLPPPPTCLRPVRWLALPSAWNRSKPSIGKGLTEVSSEINL